MKALPFFAAVVLFVSGWSNARAQAPNFAHRNFPADTVKRVIEDVTRELSLKQPGFYRYTSRTEFRRYIDSVQLTIRDSLTELQAYAKLKPIISKIHCLHTGLSLPPAYKAYLNQQPNLLPFQVYFADRKAYIIRNFSATKELQPGDEVISINGQSIEQIVSVLLPLIPADGYNLTMKFRALYYQFPTWYRTLDPADHFTLVTRRGKITRSDQINGAKYADLAGDGFLEEPARPHQLEFRIENGIGFLTIHSFAETSIKKADQNFRKFIDKTFADLRAKDIQNLVVDLRDNTGGTDHYAGYFTRYFFDQPFRYWDRIEVTEAVASEIKGLALTAFYRKPVLQDSTWRWQKSRLTAEFDFYETQQPAKNPYRGRVYVLINGFCMSSCADVAAILSSNKKAVFIGEETGGGYQGNNSGMIPETRVAPFDFVLSVPLQKYFNHVTPPPTPGRGTIPDYPVVPTLADLLVGHDRTMTTTLNLIKSRAN